MHIKDESEQKCAALWFRNVAYRGSRHHSPWKKWKYDGHIYMITLTHFWPMFLLYTPWRHQKPKVSGVFRGYKMGTLAKNGFQVPAVALNSLPKTVFVISKCITLSVVTLDQKLFRDLQRPTNSPCLTLSWRRSLSYRNQSIHLQSKY